MLFKRPKSDAIPSNSPPQRHRRNPRFPPEIVVDLPPEVLLLQTILSGYFPCLKLTLSRKSIVATVSGRSRKLHLFIRKEESEKGLFNPYRIPLLVSMGPARRSANRKGVSSLTDLPLTVLLGPDTHNNGSASLLKPLQKLNRPCLKPNKALKRNKRKMGPCPLFRSPEASGSPLRPKPQTRSWLLALLCYITCDDTYAESVESVVCLKLFY